ncbi:MAG: hypothetical protein PVI97_15625 [Candidatus Thiodiazotropha sp.]|jgi:hypothetical protein
MNTDTDEVMPFIDDPDKSEDLHAFPTDRTLLDARRKIERRKELLSLRELLDDPLFDIDLE